MEVRRVFVDRVETRDGMAVLAGPLFRYVVTVLRKAAGERIDLFDGGGNLYHCLVHSINGKEVRLKIVDTEHRTEEKRPKVTLCVSPIKGPRMDWLVEKATELRVDRIVPALFNRTVVRGEERDKGKYERWRRIAIEASRQSGRLSVPEVTAPVPLGGILPYAEDADKRWVFYEQEKKVTMKHLLSERTDGAACLVVGPEGGIEEQEIGWLEANGFHPCTLGESIFRSETAPLVILSIILHEYSEQ